MTIIETIETIRIALKQDFDKKHNETCKLYCQINSEDDKIKKTKLQHRHDQLNKECNTISQAITDLAYITINLKKIYP